jgi:hypothetical protein
VAATLSVVPAKALGQAHISKSCTTGLSAPLLPRALASGGEGSGVGEIWECRARSNRPPPGASPSASRHPRHRHSASKTRVTALTAGGGMVPAAPPRLIPRKRARSLTAKGKPRPWRPGQVDKALTRLSLLLSSCLAAALRPHGTLLCSAHDLAHALVFELLDAFSFEGLGREDVALGVDRDAVHAIELAGLAPAAAERR